MVYCFYFMHTKENTMNLCDLNNIRTLLGRHGFHFSKAMGQNFLIDASIPQAIAEHAFPA